MNRVDGSTIRIVMWCTVGFIGLLWTGALLISVNDKRDRGGHRAQPRSVVAAGEPVAYWESRGIIDETGNWRSAILQGSRVAISITCHAGDPVLITPYGYGSFGGRTDVSVSWDGDAPQAYDSHPVAYGAVGIDQVEAALFINRVLHSEVIEIDIGGTRQRFNHRGAADAYNRIGCGGLDD